MARRKGSSAFDLGVGAAVVAAAYFVYRSYQPEIAAGFERVENGVSGVGNALTHALSNFENGVSGLVAKL